MDIEEIQKRLDEFEKTLRPLAEVELSSEKAEKRQKKLREIERANQENRERIEKMKGRRILGGKGVTSGLVVGRVINVLAQVPELMAQIQPGDIVVADRLRAEHDTLIKDAAAYVTNTGGTTNSCAIMAREWNKPAVVGTMGEGYEATKELKDGQKVIVDGNEGAVYECNNEGS